MRPLPALLSLATATALLASPPEARAWCRSTTVRPAVAGDCSDAGVPLAWPSGCAGFSLYAGDAMSDVPLAVLAREAVAAAARWHDAPCDGNGTTRPYFRLVRAGDTLAQSGYHPGGRNANVVAFNPVWALDERHREGTLAVTLVSFDHDTGEILDADVELNQRSAQNPNGFRFTVGAPGPDDADLPTILTHEFGHLQGVGHSAVTLAVMWPEAGLGEQRRDLRADDAAAICDAYDPRAAPPALACDTEPRGGFDDGAADAGCACAGAPRSARGGAAGAVLAALGALASPRRRRGAR